MENVGIEISYLTLCLVQARKMEEKGKKCRERKEKIKYFLLMCLDKRTK